MAGEVFFLTGTDEHGQKCEQTALKLALPPQKHCDLMSAQFEKVWRSLDIEYSLFFRTSFDWHKQAVQQVLQGLYDQGDIYSSQYKGWYCVSEEIFYTEKDLVNGLSPTGKEVVSLEEKAWFFKMSKYQKALQKHLDTHPQFIRPGHRHNEIKSFLQKPLKDLCISRPKQRVSWGVDLPFDKNCVVYVWVDALLNYITGGGYLRDEESFKKYWMKGKTVHLIGKDILMTHAVYWPCLLLALGIPLPQTIFAHGWLLNKSSEKMSKSQGDKLDPLEMIKLLEVDGLRWFLAKEVTLGKDTAVSLSSMVQKNNEDLANNLGNIFSRVSRLIEKNFNGIVPKPPNADNLALESKSSEQGNHLKNLTEKACEKFKKQIEKFELSQALGNVSSLLVEVNKYLEQVAPWKLVKTNKEKAGFALYNSLEVLRISAILFSPVMPKKMEQLLSHLGAELGFKNIRWGSCPFEKELRHPPALFPKIKNERL